MTLPPTLLRLWAARLASKVAIYSAISYDLYQLSKARGGKEAGSMKLAVTSDDTRRLRSKSKEKSVEDVFVESLVQAGRGRECAGLPWRVPRRAHARREDVVRREKRAFSNTPARRQSAAAPMAVPEQDEVTRDEIQHLVSIYDSPSDLWDKPEHDARQRTRLPPPPTLPPEKETQPFPLAPRLVITPKQEDAPPYTPRKILKPEDASHSASIRLFRSILKRDLGRINHAKFWDVYQSLPTPRLRYIADDDIRRAFQHLTWVEYRHTPGAMPRYFQLLEDCVAEGIPVRVEEWNTAIAFAGRWVRYTTSAEVKYAVETWMRMENTTMPAPGGTTGGVKANHTTFNILFDIAVKAGRFALADTIFMELKARDLPLTRFFRTSMIYYSGMRGDGEGVRKAFRELVDAGEVVDTVVMNCVIISLIRAGEPGAAENVFSRMKTLVESKRGAEGQGGGWQNVKDLGQVLDKTAKRLRRERKQHEKSFFGSVSPSSFAGDERREEVQKLTPIAPDARTYRMLIQHHAYTSGDLGRIRELMTEMRDKGFKIHGSLYTHLLRGFGTHGGYSYTLWNRKGLQSVWDEFLAAEATQASDENGEDGFAAVQSEEDRAPYFTRALAYAAIKAWWKTAGKQGMLDAWEVIKERWKGMEQEDREVLSRLVEMLGREG
ncbi:hypothetical protein LTR22_018977 [Elasticomyces elasticus]|nr:hypothetical protein LTR22_018977 [Elasticomyces elasticus]KAK4911983.1 hypothetical protein LTR49_019545 [Elasticomyces elasticus]